MNISEVIKLNEDDLKAKEQALQDIEKKMKVLRDINPYILDMAPREGSLPASYGHTLDDKHELLRLSKDFGFKDISISAYCDHVTIDEVFAKQLRESGDSMDGYFSNLMLSPTKEGESFEPCIAMQKFIEVGTPNCLLLIDVWPETLKKNNQSYDDLFRDIKMNVEYLRQHLPEPSERRGRIFARIVDIFDAWDDDPELLVQVLKLLEQLPVQAVIFEDVRGTHFPFQNAEMVKLIRRYTPKPRLILVHSHSNNGQEDAAAIESILAGADGIWAGFTPHAAQGGHCSGAMLICNLLRAGNEHVKKSYELEKMYRTVEKMSEIHMGEPLHKDYPIFGKDSYRYLDDAFVQQDRLCDLPPELIGQTPGWRITPAFSMAPTIQYRMRELGYDESDCSNDELAQQIKILMSEKNINGERFEADRPETMASLVKEAKNRLLEKEHSSKEQVSQNGFKKILSFMKNRLIFVDSK